MNNLPTAAKKESSVAVKEGRITLSSFVEKNWQVISRAIPKEIDRGRFLNVALNMIDSMPQLGKADMASVVTALTQCSQLGLEPDNVLGMAYIIPFWNSKKDMYDVQLIIGYKGFLELARRAGVISITATLVYENEKCDMTMGLNPDIKHTPLPPDKRGKKIGAYAVATLSNDHKMFEFLWAEEINKGRELSKSAWKSGKDGKKEINESSIWVKFEDDMWKKTAIRRLSKYLPLSGTQKAASVDEAYEAGVIESLPFDIPVEALEVQYGFTEEVLVHVNKLFDALSVNQADRTMKISSLRGDKQKLTVLEQELEERVIQQAQKKLEQKKVEVAKTPEEKIILPPNPKQAEAPSAEELFGGK
jgi:recombination protein RecT